LYTPFNQKQKIAVAIIFIDSARTGKFGFIQQLNPSLQHCVTYCLISERGEVRITWQERLAAYDYNTCPPGRMTGSRNITAAHTINQEA